MAVATTHADGLIFLSIQAQDFIEEKHSASNPEKSPKFLSIQAQDFIEEGDLW